MNKHIVFLLCICSAACADLPPVSGNGGSVTPNPVAAPAKPSVSAASEYELMKRLEQLQTEVQQLTGKVEEQSYQIEDLKKRQKSMYNDFDERIQSVENKSGTGGQTAGTPEPSSPAVIDSKAPSAGEPAAAAATEQPAPALPAQEQPVSPTTPAPAAAASEPSVASAPISDAEKKDYQSAYEALRSGQTSQAITQFNTYLVDHPSSSYASNAQYWLGEAYRVNADNASAKKAFSTVVDSFPSSAKVPDALLKLGIIEAEEKNTEKAREYFTRITTDFASSRAAGLAQKRLLSLGASPAP